MIEGNEKQQGNTNEYWNNPREKIKYNRRRRSHDKEPRGLNLHHQPTVPLLTQQPAKNKDTRQKHKN